MKKWLLLLLCLMLPMAALADQVAAQDIPVYQIEPSNGFVYTDGAIPAGTAYSVIGVTYPEPGTALADYFVTSGSIVWGRFVLSDGSRTGLIVMNPGVILGEQTYTELEAVEAEARFRAYGNNYTFTPLEDDDQVRPSETALVLCQSLTLWERPDVTSTAMASLPYESVLTCTGNWYPGWLEVIADGQTGWVREEFLLLDPTYITFAVETPVLAWPSSDAPWIGLLDAGSAVPVLGEWDEYMIISLRGASGFVAQ